MAQDEIKKIMINGHLVGIVGLEDAIKKVSSQTQSDKKIKSNLLRDISSNNYIPSSARDAYGNALLREWKLAQGLPVADEQVQGLNIAVVGMSCARCSQLEDDIRDLLSEMNIAANLHHVNDLKEIAHYGLLGSPALVINNKVLSVGEVPSKSKIRQWIIEANKPIRNC